MKYKQFVEIRFVPIACQYNTFQRWNKWTQSGSKQNCVDCSHACWGQAKFLACEISDFTPCAHAQTNILHIKYAERSDD